MNNDIGSSSCSIWLYRYKPVRAMIESISTPILQAEIYATSVISDHYNGVYCKGAYYNEHFLTNPLGRLQIHRKMWECQTNLKTLLKPTELLYFG